VVKLLGGNCNISAYFSNPSKYAKMFGFGKDFNDEAKKDIGPEFRTDELPERTLKVSSERDSRVEKEEQ
jgi:hypothetical protein